jgi:hypothetical protein
MSTSRDLLVKASSEPLVAALERAARRGESFLVHGGSDALHRPSWEVIAAATGRKTAVLATADYDRDQGSWLGAAASRAVGAGAEVLVLGHLYTPEAVLVAERMSVFTQVVASCLAEGFAGAVGRLAGTLVLEDRQHQMPALGFSHGLGVGPLGSERVVSWDAHSRGREVRYGSRPELEDDDVIALWRPSGPGDGQVLAVLTDSALSALTAPERSGMAAFTEVPGSRGRLVVGPSEHLGFWLPRVAFPIEPWVTAPDLQALSPLVDQLAGLTTKTELDLTRASQAFLPAHLREDLSSVRTVEELIQDALLEARLSGEHLATAQVLARSWEGSTGDLVAAAQDLT